MNENTILSALKSRRSIRKFTNMDVSEESVNTILEAARWAPSGLNHQPWRFITIRDQKIKISISELTKYHAVIENCNMCIAVFYNMYSGYNRDKDILSIGACIQNMLLAVESEGLGAVWLGEILKRKAEVNAILDVKDENELMAVIALGYPDEKPSSERNEMESLILKTLQRSKKYSL